MQQKGGVAHACNSAQLHTIIKTSRTRVIIKMLNNVGMAVLKIIQTRCSTYAARPWMIAYITCVTPSLHGVMHVIIVHCLAAYVLHLVCMIFGTAIPTLFNILMKCFYFCVSLGMRLTIIPCLHIRWTPNHGIYETQGLGCSILSI